MSNDHEYRVEFDPSDTMKMLDSIGVKMDKQAPDSIAAKLTQALTNQLKVSLQENGSVATGQGLNSIESVHLDTGVYGVRMAGYLEHVDKGTSAHHPPVKNNHRLQEWVSQNGVDPYALAKSIARKGTQAHPFKDEAVSQVESRAEQIGADELTNIIQR